VIVNSLVYGTDDSRMVDALRQLGHRVRGMPSSTTKHRTPNWICWRMRVVCGIRLNFMDLGVPDPEIGRQRFQAAVKCVVGRGLHIQIYSRLAVIEALQEDVMAAPVSVVFDHFAGAQASLGVSPSGFDALLKLVRSGKVHVNISGAYRSSNRAPEYSDVEPLAQALIAATPQRILWGSDWPHPDSSRVESRRATNIAPLLQFDDGRLFNQLALWAPDANVRKTILTENPARSYNF